MECAQTKSRGFTLLEMMVTVAIIAILAAMSMAGLQQIRPRMDVGTAANKLTVALHAARSRAISTGSLVWFVWFPPASGEPNSYLVFEDWDGDFDPLSSDLPDDPGNLVTVETAPTALDFTNGGLRRDSIVVRETLPRRVNAVLGTDWGSDTQVPDAFNFVGGLGQVLLADANNNGCSFCFTSNGNRGWIRFLPNGEVRFSTENVGDAQPRGGLIALAGELDSGENTNFKLISISAPFGLVRSM